MSDSIRDRIAGTVLFAAALLWIGLVYWTIPSGVGASASARTFPFWLGIALAALSILLAIRDWWQSAAGTEASAEQHPQQPYSVIATMIAIVGYGFFMEKLGFLPATALAVAAMLIVVLRIRNAVMITSMSIGLAIGCYILFGKLLGTYLPPGTWITLYF